MMYKEMAIKKGCGRKEWRSCKGKDKESDIDDGLSMLLLAAFLTTHLP